MSRRMIQRTTRLHQRRLYRPGAKRFRHVKRGSTYTLLGYGKLQIGTPAELDMMPVAVYQGDDGELWARPVTEFEDGRFERIEE